jgi:hypothetical protein
VSKNTPHPWIDSTGPDYVFGNIKHRGVGPELYSMEIKTACGVKNTPNTFKPITDGDIIQMLRDHHQLGSSWSYENDQGVTIDGETEALVCVLLAEAYFRTRSPAIFATMVDDVMCFEY